MLQTANGHTHFRASGRVKGAHPIADADVIEPHTDVAFPVASSLFIDARALILNAPNDSALIHDRRSRAI